VTRTGSAARDTVVPRTDNWKSASRTLFDGTPGRGPLQPEPENATVTAKWSDLGAGWPATVRDLWQRKDLGVFTDALQR